MLMALMLSVVNAHVSGLDLSVRFPSKVGSAFLIPQMLTAGKCHPLMCATADSTEPTLLSNCSNA